MCNEIEKKTLDAIVTHFASVPFEQQQLKSHVHSALSGSELRVGLYLLQKKGLIEVREKIWGEELFFLPYSKLIHAHQILKKKFVLQNCLAENSARTYRHMEHRDLLDDMLIFLSFVREGLLRLTSKGTLHKRIVDQLASRLRIQEEDLKTIPMNYRHEAVYPKHVALVYDLALRLDFVTEQVNVCILNEEKVLRFFQKGRQRCMQILYEKLTEVYRPEEPWMQSVVGWLETCSTDVWYSLTAVIDHGKNCGVIPIHIETLEASRLLHQQWLKLLVAAGLMDIREEEPLCFSLEDFSSTISETKNMKCFYTQPTLDIITIPNIPPDIVWTLECWLERELSAETIHYAFTTQRLETALTTDAHVDDFLRFLDEHSINEVPASVIEWIKHRSAQFESITFQDVSLMKCKDRSLADELSSHAVFSSLLQKRIGETYFALTDLEKKEIQTLLATEGYMFQNGAVEKKTVQVQENQHKHFSGERGLVYDKHIVNALKVVSELQISVAPMMNKIPKSWYEQFQAYHSSTYLKILLHAIEYELFVHVSIANKIYKFIPESLEKIEEEWYIFGSVNEANAKWKVKKIEGIRLGIVWKELNLA